MGRLPMLSMTPKVSNKQLGAFGGLNKGLVIGGNEFSDMKNMCSDQFPAIAVRKPRGEIIKKLEKPHGLFWKNGLAYADGTKLYYQDKKIGTVTDTDKQMVGMGAYIVIFPDKLMYNTSTGELKGLEASWTQGAAATFAQTTTGSTMVKISCTGIGSGFSQFDGVEISGCTNAEFNKTTVIQELAADYIIIVGNLKETFTQDSGLKITRKTPDMDYICENGNRIWGCSSKNHEVYSSKLGDPTNWQAYEGISTDSYAATVGSDGDFTGCLSHMGYVLFFKEDVIHKIFGEKPSNYQINTTSPVRGIAKGCEKTACIVNETLLYVSRNNVCSYDGAYPESVSDALAEARFSGGVAGQYNGKYYASLSDASGNWNLYVYDLKKGMWHREDSLHALFMAYGEGQLYCIDADHNLFTISGTRDEYIEWMIESGDMMDGTVEFKYLRRLLFNLLLEPGSEVDVFLKCDGEPEFRKKISFTSTGYRTQTLNVIPDRCQRYRFRLEGKGPAALIALSKYIGYGSDIHGCI